MSVKFDIAVVGSGFAGSLTAMIARRLGLSVALLERGRHPRFVIGESSTPLANLLLEEIATRYDLPALRPLCKWGSWQRTYPAIGCGLKRGFTFYHHRLNRPFGADPDRRDQLLVAASPRDEIADTHWYRPDFDQFLVHTAQRLGVEYVDQLHLDRVEFAGGNATLTGMRQGESRHFSARLVIDATGPRGFLHLALGLRQTPIETLPRTQALFTHFSGVRRWDEMFPGLEPPPYPVDDAAVHHVFDGGWIWVLRFNNGVTSAGVAATDRLANELDLSLGAPAWKRLLQRLPTIREQFRDSVARFPFVHAPRLSFQSESVAGGLWVLLPSAAGFVDPLLSTGFPLTLLGIVRLARVLEEDLGSSRLENALKDYGRQTRKELGLTAELVGALYATMDDFELFAALTLLYFAAASFSEAARRMRRPDLSPGFLLVDHPDFGPQVGACCRSVREAAAGGRLAAAKSGLLAGIAQIIGPFNLAELNDPARRNWYPADPRDLLNAAGKLEATEAEVQAMLRRCGLES